MAAALNILILDDDEGDRKHFRRSIADSKIANTIFEARSVQDALDASEHHAFNCALVDYSMPDNDGLDGIKALLKRIPGLAIIMSTGQGDEMVASEAIKQGAYDYIPKSKVNSVTIKRVIENAVEKQQLEEQVKRQKNDLENFSRILAHDLKQPTTSIIGFSDIIGHMLKQDDFDKEKAIAYCKMVSSSVGNMAELIDTLHQYNQADADIELKRVDMNRVISSVVTDLEDLIESSNAEINVGSLSSVMGSEPQLRQLFQNLIANGIKYCEADVPMIKISEKQDGDKIIFEVTDNGLGIPEDFLTYVFEPFKRVPGAEEYEGTGLGLATCKRIIERHNGIILCESQIGVGSTFSFILNGINT